MRVLLTGGAGFIGSHVAEQLLDRGHEVGRRGRSLLRQERENVPEAASFYHEDIRSGCAEVFAMSSGPKALCHQAAQMDVRRSVREPDFDAEVNVIGTVRLLENCVRHGVYKVVFASTGGAIYGAQEEFPAPESHPHILYPLRRLQACGRALPQLLQRSARPVLRRLALRQRLRSAARPARRSGGRGDLLQQPGQ